MKFSQDLALPFWCDRYLCLYYVVRIRKSNANENGFTGVFLYKCDMWSVGCNLSVYKYCAIPILLVFGVFKEWRWNVSVIVCTILE